MRQNKLRELLNAGKPTVGTRLANLWPTMVELVGHSQQFDYVEFLTEYVPYDLATLENLGRALDLHSLGGMVKIEQESRQHLAVRAAMSGIQNMLFADVKTAEEVAECVRCVRADAPSTGGHRGVGMGRDVGILLEGSSPAFVQSTVDAVIALMIEKKDAVENLGSILAVPGVDMIQFGPGDYSVSMGMAGQSSHPAVKEAEEYTIQATLKAGKAPRAEIKSPEDAERYLKLGVKHFSLGTEMSVMFRFYKEGGALLREMLQVA